MFQEKRQVVVGGERCVGRGVAGGAGSGGRGRQWRERQGVAGM